jgi:hypothetical protein
MSEVHSVDALLSSVQAANQATPVPSAPKPELSVVAPPVPDVQPLSEQPQPEIAPPEQSAPAAETVTPEPEKAAPEPTESRSDSPIDEYGNPVAKPKMYTEDEVQAMIKRRLKNRPDLQEPAPAPKPAQPSSKADSEPSESAEDWESQLNQYIDKRVENREKEAREREWRDRAVQEQTEFETKFTTGMSKYQDFREVVADKPITDTMMLATKSLGNPASFIYAACKLHPNEISRISRITDPYSQALEVGRLHERMVKDQAVASRASKPLEAPKGDVADRRFAPVSIDSRIAEHAKQKNNQRR